MRKDLISLTAILATIPTMSFGQGIPIPRNAVIKATLNDSISLVRNEPGDTFSATVHDDRDLPNGTRFVGHVVDIHPGYGRRPGSATLRFDQVLLPDGSMTHIYAVPVRANLLVRDRDGRFHVDQKRVNGQDYVLGGFVGGAIIGGIFRRPFEGAFLGTLAGIIAADSASADNDDQYVFHHGDTVGVLVKDDFVVGGRPPLRHHSDGDDIHITVDDHSLYFDTRELPYSVGGVVMVPVLSTARQLRLDADQARGGDVVYLDNEHFSARIERDAPDMRLNGDRVALPHPAEVKDGILYMPLEVLRQMEIGKLRVNGSDF